MTFIIYYILCLQYNVSLMCNCTKTNFDSD